MNELRKGFFVFDMAVFGFFLFALNHTMFIESWIVEAALDFSLLLRLTVSILLYKREHLAIQYHCLLFIRQKDFWESGHVDDTVMESICIDGNTIEQHKCQQRNNRQMLSLIQQNRNGET